jgi:type IV pilus assembly protein PilA
MMQSRYENAKGFTLIELMIVVAIISVLAALAIAGYRSHQCRAKQAEAKTLLGMIQLSEEAYFTEYNAYSSDAGKIGFSSKGETRYNYSIVTAPDGFTATATSKAEKNMDGDAWTIDETAGLTNISPGCT